MSTCKLKKCQGRRGCLCPKKPTKVGVVYQGVVVDVAPASGQMMGMVGKGASPSRAVAKSPAKGSPAKQADKSPPKAAAKGSPAKGSGAPAKGAPAAGKGTTDGKAAEASGSDAPAGSSEAAAVTPAAAADEAPKAAEASAATAPAEPAKEAAPTEPVEGKTILRYNHYRHEVDIVAPPGEVKIPDINELFSFSYGFKGDYEINIRGPGSSTTPLGELPLLERVGDPKEGTIVGLEIGKEYFCDVTEDPEEAKKEKKTYKATGGGEKGIKIDTGDGAGDGEDSASCSCVEGNPCAVKYNCKNWNNRLEVAKANGWKGF